MGFFKKKFWYYTCEHCTDGRSRGNNEKRTWRTRRIVSRRKGMVFGMLKFNRKIIPVITLNGKTPFCKFCTLIPPYAKFIWLDQRHDIGCIKCWYLCLRYTEIHIHDISKDCPWLYPDPVEKWRKEKKTGHENKERKEGTKFSEVHSEREDRKH